MKYIEIFQIMEPRNLLKPYFETSVTFEPFGIFDVVFTVVLRRMNSYHFIHVSGSTLGSLLR